MKLRGKIALVTGAAVRVGQEIALELARGGADVIVHYNRSAGPAAATVKRIRQLKRRAGMLQADLSDVEETERLARDAQNVFGRIDILVNSAAVYFKTPIPDVTAGQWDAFLNANLRGPFFLAQRLGTAMKRHGSGKIVNIADWAAIRPYSGYLPYCVSKAGIITMTQGFSKAFAPQVQVNAIAPGPILLPPDFTISQKKAVIRATPLKRIGTPADIAKTVRFLIEGSDFITGAVIPVDGGRMVA